MAHPDDMEFLREDAEASGSRLGARLAVTFELIT
jgi:hypothetical protein